MEAQLLAAVGVVARVEVGELARRPATRTRAGPIATDAFISDEVEHDAARERHGLAVIAGAGAARR